MTPPSPCPIAALPREHPDRNTPLAGWSFRIWAAHDGEATDPFPRNLIWKWGAWRAVHPSWKIAGKTYNDLGAVWTDRVEWRKPKGETK